MKGSSDGDRSGGTAMSSEQVLSLGDIPATFALPGEHGRPVPAVLLLHGTASHRDEVADMFRRTAAALAERGIASLRIDFAGCGDSTRPQTSFTVTSELADARAALAWLSDNPAIDRDRIAVLGFSQGGMIALLLAAEEPRAAGLVSWSSGVMSTDDRSGIFAELFRNGEQESLLDLGFTSFLFSREWWNEFLAADLVSAAEAFAGPVLAVCGAADRTVHPQASVDLLHTIPSADGTLLEIAGADHIFNALETDGSDASHLVIRTTAEWLAERLASPTT